MIAQFIFRKKQQQQQKTGLNFKHICMQFSLLALFCYQTVKRKLQDLSDLMREYFSGPGVLRASLHTAQYLMEASAEAYHCSCYFFQLFSLQENCGRAVTGWRWRIPHETERSFLTALTPNYHHVTPACCSLITMLY